MTSPGLLLFCFILFGYTYILLFLDYLQNMYALFGILHFFGPVQNQSPCQLIGSVLLVIVYIILKHVRSYSYLFTLIKITYLTQNHVYFTIYYLHISTLHNMDFSTFNNYSKSESNSIPIRFHQLVIQHVVLFLNAFLILLIKNILCL